MNEKARKYHLLIGAGSFADAKPALRIAEALLSFGQSDISGILVEETQDVEALPEHARCIVTQSGAICVAPTMEKRSLLLKGDAKAFRDSLIQLAKGQEVNWRIDREEGDPVNRLLSTELKWSALLIGHRIIGRQSGSVVTLSSKGGLAIRTRTLSQSLSQMLRTAVMELDFEQLGSELLKTLNQISAAVVVIEVESGQAINKEQIRKILEASRCPVLIVSASEVDEPQQ